MSPTLHRCLRLTALATFGFAIFALSGCLSPKYKMARKDTPPPRILAAAFPSAPVAAPLAATLETVIAYGGPGSWKREAFWDEYVVTVRNPGDQPLTLSSVTLLDPLGATHAPGTDPWLLEKESKTLARKFTDAGIAFVKAAVPTVLVVGGALAGSTASLMAGPGAAAGTSALGTAVIVALPVYYIAVITINHHRKTAVAAEFDRRRLALPLTLASGETRTGSFFFPMVPNPRSLTLRWSAGAGAGQETALPLDILNGLHVKSTGTTP